MILKIKAMGYRFDDIYVTMWAGEEQAGRLIFKPAEWDAFIAALRAGAPNAGITLNITEDIEDDLPSPVSTQDKFDQDDPCPVCPYFGIGSQICNDCKADPDA